jgi:protease II
VVTNVSGVSAPASKTVQVLNCTDGGVGIAENNNLSANVSVFPNPAHDVVNISVPVSGSDVYKVKLINVIGAVVYEEKISKENFSINLAGKAKGVYFLSIENNTQKAVKKIVIE